MSASNWEGRTGGIHPSTWSWFRKRVKERIDLRTLDVSRLKRVRYSNGYITACCPFHDDQTPSLRITRRTFECFACGARGDLFDWLEAKETMGLSKREALEMASQLSGTPLPTGKEGSWGVPHARRDFNSSVAKHSEKVQDWPRRRLQEILAQSLDGDHHTAVPLGLYREARGLTAAPCPKALRFHPRLPYYHSPEGREGVLIGGYPAMLALVTGADGELATIQRLYLTPLGQKLTLTYEGETLPARKQMTAVRPGATMGAAVRLFEATNVLAVAEGIETALAFHLLTGLPAWSCLSAQGMANVIIPDTVEEVVIAADRDVSGVGLQFSHKLARRLHTDRKRVSIAMPPDLNPGGNTDWNDVLLDGGNNDE